MFFGEHHHSLDEKGRVILPAKFREALADGLFITKSFDKCLTVYTKKDWFALVERINALPTTTDLNVRNFQRFLVGGATEGEISRQGRISIPQNLREFAGLERDIVIVGLANKVEIWAKEKYEEFTANVDQAAPDIAGAMTAFGV